MKRLGVPIILCVCWAAPGCISGMVQPVASTKTMPVKIQSASPASLSRAVRPLEGRSPAQDDDLVWVADEQPASEEAIASDDAAASDATPASDERSASDGAAGVDEESTLIKVREEISTPQPSPAPDVVPAGRDDDQDRFARQVTDVPLDIRPPRGPLPPDLAAEEAAEDPGRREPWAGEDRVPIVCSFTPWTICYRPLYFEDIELERYGRSYGIVQPAVSAAHFFGTVPLMPYKMVVRPPRSCDCSNGFSRPGDQPPPGYGDWALRLDAAAVEAAVITGLVLALP